MQFTTIVISAFMAASAIAAPALEARQEQVIGTIDLYARSGCQPQFVPSIPNFNLTLGTCFKFPAGQIAGNVTTLLPGFTVTLYNDETCTSGSQIKLPTTQPPNFGLKQCQEPGNGLKSWKGEVAA